MNPYCTNLGTGATLFYSFFFYIFTARMRDARYAERGIAAANRLSVCPSVRRPVRPSVALKYRDHIIQCESKKSPRRGPDIFSFFSQTVENLLSIFYTSIKRFYLR